MGIVQQGRESMKDHWLATYRFGYWVCAHCAHEVDDAEDWHLQPCACECSEVDHPWNKVIA